VYRSQIEPELVLVCIQENFGSVAIKHGFTAGRFHQAGQLTDRRAQAVIVVDGFQARQRHDKHHRYDDHHNDDLDQREATPPRYFRDSSALMSPPGFHAFYCPGSIENIGSNMLMTIKPTTRPSNRITNGSSRLGSLLIAR